MPPGTNVEAEKEPLKAPLPKPGTGPTPRLAVIVVHDDAVTPAAGSDRFGTYDLFLRGKLDDRLVDDIHVGLREAIVAARLSGLGMDPARIKNLTTVTRPASRTVTAEGERTTNREMNMLLPAAFMILLLMSVMTSGQYLLTSTVEEKSNRVVEVLLSAVSAMELMTGKILGQMAVGFLVLALYAGLGLVALVSFATLGLIDPLLLVFLVVFYLLAYFTFASMMAAVGSAVNEMREAQSMMMPIMMILMVPWILWLPLSREPNSMLAVSLSFIPPFSNFVMLLRMTSVSPPPMWQPVVAIAIGAGRRLGLDLVRRKGVPGGPADVRQAPELRDAGQVGQDELSELSNWELRTMNCSWELPAVRTQFVQFVQLASSSFSRRRSAPPSRPPAPGGS